MCTYFICTLFDSIKRLSFDTKIGCNAPYLANFYGGYFFVFFMKVILKVSGISFLFRNQIRISSTLYHTVVLIWLYSCFLLTGTENKLWCTKCYSYANKRGFSLFNIHFISQTKCQKNMSAIVFFFRPLLVNW